MIAWKDLRSGALVENCKGLILSARIYSDTPGYKCQCGGVFNKRIEHDDHKGLMVPKCNTCNKYPPVFHIDADAKDPDGNTIRVKVRNDMKNNRLTNISQVIFTMQNIQEEIMSGEFDVTRYVSKDARESFRFKNYILKYEEFHNERLVNNEITPKALRDKKSLIKKYILPFFGKYDLVQIKEPLIHLFHKEFFKEYGNYPRSRDLAISELRTILKQAKKDGKIKIVPEFDKIPKAKRRMKIISMDLINETIGKITNPVYVDILTLMTMYPFRPSEIRALRWKDIDFINDKINVIGHFSDEVWIDGRKSIESGDGSFAEYDIVSRSREILNRYRASRIPRIDRETDWVFRGANDRHISEDALSDAWRIARELTETPHKHQMYEIRHRCLTDFGKRVNGDIMKMQQFSKHKNVNTLMDRYIRSEADLSGYIQ